MGFLFVTIPHSGEKVPPEITWLKGLAEPLLMCDVDRFVDQVYGPALQHLRIPFVKTEWHRYFCDLNRFPDDVDVDSVQGSPHARGKFSRGLLWSITTRNEKLMPQPISPQLHQEIVNKYYEPFHREIAQLIEKLRAQGEQTLFHLDVHSMPSLGTKEHRDPGERRADLVIGDCQGQSASPFFRDLVIDAYRAEGFSVSLNWPYYGGRISERYGKPAAHHHTLLVELNRALYMNEETKQARRELWPELQPRLERVLVRIQQGVRTQN